MINHTNLTVLSPHQHEPTKTDVWFGIYCGLQVLCCYGVRYKSICCTIDTIRINDIRTHGVVCSKLEVGNCPTNLLVGMIVKHTNLTPCTEVSTLELKTNLKVFVIV